MNTKYDFVKNYLISKIFMVNDDLKEYQLIDSEVSIPQNVDGFMSIIFLVKLKLENKSKVEKTIETREIIVKIIKFGDEMRSKWDVGDQFLNEIFVYQKLIPYYNKLLKSSCASFVMNDLVPNTYFASYDYFPELGETKETVLAMENLNVSGYRLGPRLILDEIHLLHMAKSIAKYHSLTYAMRIQGDPKLQEFINEIVPIRFIRENGECSHLNHLYIMAFERLFKYLEKKPHHSNPKLLKDMEMFERKYKLKPLLLMEKLRIGGDDDYSVILHGDYLRNNVMFKYDSNEGFDNSSNCKMFDFQEMRYGSPALDISLFMFMNMDSYKYEEFWNVILKCYHDTLIESLGEILICPKTDERLQKYSYENFTKHFQEFAFYGAAVSIHFLPWMTCPDKDCTRFGDLFETDLYGDELRELTFTAGGDQTNEIIVNVIKHASKLGYMDIVYKD